MITKEMTLADVVKEYPGTIPYLNEYRLDYCCGGHDPIEKIAKEKKFEWWNKEKTALIDFSFLTEDSFQISISFMEKDVVGGYSITYLFKKINGNILLYLVRSI